MIDEYNSKLKKFVNISKGYYDTKFGLFKAFAGDKLFCPILEGFDICSCNISTNKEIKIEYGFPICSISSNEINNNSLSLASALANTFKPHFKFCNKCNLKPESYYAVKQFKLTGEDAVYSQHIIKNVKLPKFLSFIFVGNNEEIINGEKTKNLVKDKLIIKQQAYNLVGGILAPSESHLRAFIYNCEHDYFDLHKGEHYYYDGLLNGGAVEKIGDTLNFIIEKNSYLVIYLKE